ncbi:MAG: hypothetical protein ACREAK_06030 [Nitrosarchaeum sp.]
MSEFSLRCCNNEPEYLIDYGTQKKYLVCKKCFKLAHWNIGIKQKESLCK